MATPRTDPAPVTPSCSANTKNSNPVGGALPPVPAIGSVEEFDQLVAKLDAAAHEWGLRPSSNESRFVSALLGCTRWMGRLSEASIMELRDLLNKQRETGEIELAHARELARATNAALSQARNVKLFLQVEQENLVQRMIKETLPLFAENLKGALVIRERALNLRAKQRRFLVYGLIVFGFFLSGYVARAWADRDSIEALGRCLAHPLQAQGQIYCNVTRFAEWLP